MLTPVVAQKEALVEDKVEAVVKEQAERRRLNE